MGGREPSERIQIDERAYFKWLEGRGQVLGEGLSMLRPTLRNAVLLSLLENTERALTYSEIAGILRRKNLISSRNPATDDVSVESLRLAVSDVSKLLQRSKSGYLVRAERANRRGSFSLVRREKILDPVQESSRMLQGFHSPLLAPESIANQLVRDGGGLPFASLYTSYRSAAQWICYSGGVNRAVTDYQTDALGAYDVLSQLGFTASERRSIAFVGLGIGEGSGEASILRRLLGDERISSIHYLAVDSSEVLLLSHVSLLRDDFRHEIENGRLQIAPVCGDLFRLTEQVRIARSVKGNMFLSGMPILVSYLGNNLGNQEGQEWSFFSSVLESFPEKRSPLCFLVEVSEARWIDKDAERREAMVEDYRIDTFLLQMPRTLMERGVLTSLTKSGERIAARDSTEFLQTIDPAPERIAPEPYNTSLGIRGAVYRMCYTLENGLGTGDGKYTLPPGGRLHLYSIVKYDIESLAAVLRSRALEVKEPRDGYFVLEKNSGAETFRCAALAVFRK